jgi:hypothetical protein
MITEPSSSDVLCGRGMAIRSWEGNQKYIKLINDLREDYENAKKGHKMDVVKRVLDAVQNETGRFLQKKGEFWVEIEEEKAAFKTSQAFRDLRVEDTASAAVKAPTTIKQRPIKKFDYSLLKKHAPAGRFSALLAQSKDTKNATSDVATEQMSSSSSEEESSDDDSGSDNDAQSGEDGSSSGSSSSEEESNHDGDVSETETEDSFPMYRGPKSR